MLEKLNVQSTKCESSNNVMEKHLPDEKEKTRNKSALSFLKNPFKLGDQRVGGVSMIPKRKFSVNQHFVTFDNQFKVNSAVVGSNDWPVEYQYPGKFGFVSWTLISKQKASTSQISLIQSELQRCNSKIIFKNLLQVYSRSCYDFISPGFVRNSYLTNSRIAPIYSNYWTKLSLIRQIATGMKLSSVPFPKLRSIDQNIQTVFFTWITNIADDKFYSYPDEYIFDILIMTFMEHQGIISIREFDILLWTVVAVNENLINNDQNYHDINPRAERIAVWYAQLNKQMLEIANRTVEFGNSTSIVNYYSMSIVEKLKLRHSNRCQMSSFNEHYFVHQHSFYMTPQSQCDQIQCFKSHTNNTFNNLEYKLNLNLFNKMKFETKKLRLPAQRIIAIEYPNDGKIWIKKWKLWLKNKMINLKF